MTDWTRPLHELGLADADRYGGKAAGLGAAMRHGARVPEGFAIDGAVFDTVLEKAGLTAERALLLEAVRRDEDGWEARADAFAERLLTLTWPAPMQEYFMKELMALPKSLIAVRSSANLEDGEATSAAGLFESQLQVPPADLFKAANRSWAAAHRPRVFAHLLAVGLDPARLRLPLVVMTMRRPDFSGVLFTVDDADPGRERMRVAFTEGLGAKLVEGETGLDATLPRCGSMPRLALPGWLAKRLRRIGLKLERRFGRALDIEWASEGYQVWVLQARPIAGMPPGAEGRPAIRWSRDLAEERFPDPISPLGWTALESALRVNMTTLDRRFGLSARRPDELATVIGGYVYNNRDFFAIPHSMRFRWRAHAPFLGRYLRVVAGVVAPWRWPHALKLLTTAVTPLGSHPDDPRYRAVAGLFEAFVFHHADEVERAWDRDFPTHLAAMRDLDGEDVKAMATPELMAYARRVIARSDAFMEPDLAIYVIKMACRWLVTETAALADGEKCPEVLATLTGGLEANATMAMNEALDELTRAVAADAPLAAALKKGHAPAIRLAWATSGAAAVREVFLREYGHIGLSWDIREPTYRDRPALLDELLAARLEAVVHAPDRSALAAAREAEANRIEGQLPPWARAFFRRLLTTLHTAMRLDEEHHLNCGRLIPAERRIVAELAGRMVAAGAFDAPDDIHFLTLEEVFALADEAEPWSRRRRVARRREAFERAIAAKPISEYHGDRPVLAQGAVPGADGALTGAGASGGIYEGTVRVVATMADMAAFVPGEVLVVPTPKPSFTPLFAVAGALVTARGSTLSHGLVMAREYGLPAVTEVHDALTRLKTGQRVRVDGHAGTVTPLTSRPIRLPRKLGGGR